MCCPETSIRFYQRTPRDVPEERRPELHRGESLKSRIERFVRSIRTLAHGATHPENTTYFSTRPE
jgi:hypothetical protein